jgi:hypothetical protein
MENALLIVSVQPTYTFLEAEVACFSSNLLEYKASHSKSEEP